MIEKEENFIIIFFARKRSLWEKFQTEKGIIVPLILLFFIRLEKLDKIIFPIYDGQRYLKLRRQKISKFLHRLIKEREASIYISDWCLYDLLEESLRDAIAPFLHQYFKLRDLICTRIPYVEEEKEVERNEPSESPLVRYLQEFPGEFVTLRRLLEDMPRELRGAVWEVTNLMDSIKTLEDIYADLLEIAQSVEAMLSSCPKDLKDFFENWKTMAYNDLFYNSLKHIEWMLYTSVGAFHIFMLIQICLASSNIALALQYTSNFIQTTASLVLASDSMTNVLDKKDCFKWGEVLTEWSWRFNNAKCRFRGGLVGALSNLSECKYASEYLHILTELMKMWSESITKYRNISPLAHGFVLKAEVEELKNVSQFEKFFSMWKSCLLRVVERISDFFKTLDLDSLEDELREELVNEIVQIKPLLEMLLAINRPKTIDALLNFTSESSFQLFWLCLLQEEFDLTTVDIEY